mmetsp:Transcript_71891/g.233669  ORF Transcript_71891/g.233669 Transcript_71891/m.233669 type:complete len:212 (-) Transcript_71891:692-1327(-)
MRSTHLRQAQTITDHAETVSILQLIKRPLGFVSEVLHGVHPRGFDCVLPREGGLLKRLPPAPDLRVAVLRKVIRRGLVQVLLCATGVLLPADRRGLVGVLRRVSGPLRPLALAREPCAVGLHAFDHEGRLSGHIHDDGLLGHQALAHGLQDALLHAVALQGLLDVHDNGLLGNLVRAHILRGALLPVLQLRGLFDLLLLGGGLFGVLVLAL